MKFPYFAETTERGEGIGGERQGEFPANFNADFQNFNTI
jgi:hypothetical protein